MYVTVKIANSLSFQTQHILNLHCVWRCTPLCLPRLCNVYTAVAYYFKCLKSIPCSSHRYSVVFAGQSNKTAPFLYTCTALANWWVCNVTIKKHRYQRVIHYGISNHYLFSKKWWKIKAERCTWYMFKRQCRTMNNLKHHTFLCVDTFREKLINTLRLVTAIAYFHFHTDIFIGSYTCATHSSMYSIC